MHSAPRPRGNLGPLIEKFGIRGRGQGLGSNVPVLVVLEEVPKVTRPILRVNSLELQWILLERRFSDRRIVTPDRTTSGETITGLLHHTLRE